MASLLFPMRRLLAPTRALRTVHQRRWAQVHDIRLLATAEQPRAVTERYRAKLNQKVKEAGVESIDDLKTAYSDKIAEVRRKEIESYPLPQGLNGEAKPAGGSTTTSSSSTPPPASTAASSSAPGGSGAVKPLSSYIDLDKARDLPEKELTAIWRLRHANAPLSLCATIPNTTYSAMESAARSAPQFVLPIPHPEQGAEIHFLQWVFDAETNTSTVMFTQLAEYKARGEFAQPHTTVTHHVDLAGGKAGLVLMQGQLVEGRGAKIEDARFLVLLLQKFYGGWGQGGQAKQLVEWFANGDSRFTVEGLLEEAERLA